MNCFRLSFCLLATTMIVGAKTRVTIKGMQTKTESEMLYLIGGRLTHVEGKTATASRADDAAFLLTQVMRKDGYAQVQVTPRVVNSNEIQLMVNEGGRLSLGKVEVRDVTVEEASRLSKVYSNPASKDRPIGSGSAPFREEDVEQGLALVKQDLNSMGYWAAEAKIASRNTDPDGKVNVVIDVDQGPLFKIGSPKIVSLNGDSRKMTAENASPFVGRTATTANISAMRVAVTEAFTGTGYADAKIMMGRTLDSPRWVPDFTIDLGKRVKLRDIKIAGLEKTNGKRIEDRLSDLEGDWYDEAAMNKRLRELLGTGAFSSVRVDTDPVGEDSVDATLHLEEAKAREVSFGGGFGSYEGAIFRTTYTDRNLFGQLLGFSTGFEFSSRGVLGETKIINPWLFGSDYSMTSRLYALIYARDGYSTIETGADTIFSRTFAEHFKTDLLFGYSLVSVTADGLDDDELGDTNYTHSRIALTETIDFRDNPVLPKTGWHLKMPLQVGGVVGDMNTMTYFKGGASGGWYHPLGKAYTLALGGAFGFIIPSGDSFDLPIDLRLFNGGARSVRSFPERELGPKGKGKNPTGGDASWVVNAEVTRGIAGPLRGVAFVDAGSLARELSELGSADLEVAVGLGVRIDLPIGPVRLEYGYNLTQDGDDPVGALHFAIGAAF